jgi:hypothetical protein
LPVEEINKLPYSWYAVDQPIPSNDNNNDLH